MKITIRTHHIDITPALKEYAEKKAEKLEKYFESIQEVQIELDVVATADENERQLAIGIIKASQTLIRAEVASKDMYASIDLLEEKLETQLRKHKEKLKSHEKSRQKRSLNAPVKVAPRKVEVSEDAKLMAAKPIDVEEAADILVMEKTRFLVFRNAQTQQINVIYPISKGHFGLIET